MDRKNILVIGATGFIGTHLAERLKTVGHNLYCISKSMGFDVCDRGSFNDFLNKGIDIVFDLAGGGFVPASWADPGHAYTVNVLGTQHTLDFCKATKAKLIYVSSYVYGIPEYLPIDENHPTAPCNPYSHSKLLGEKVCEFYSHNMDVEVLILRPFNIYGPGQKDHFLIPSIIRQAVENGSITVKDATPRRDFLHVSDFVNACLTTIDYKRARFDIFNIGSGISFSVEEIINFVIGCLGKKIEWVATGDKRTNEIPDTIADCKHIHAVLSWKPEISLREGLSGLVNLRSRRAH